MNSEKLLLVIICGLPGTGKTLVAKALAKEIDAVHLNSDAIRKELFPNPNYSEKEKIAVYNRMFEKANALLELGINVILDATFFKESLRKKAIKIASKNNAKYVIIKTGCNDEIVKKFLKKRTSRSLSDANYEIYKKLKLEFEPLREEHLVLDCEKTIDEKLGAVLKWIKEEL